MSLPNWAQAYIDQLHAGHADAAQYVVAYLSSSGIEALVIGAGVSVALYRLGRGVVQALVAHETSTAGREGAFQ